MLPFFVFAFFVLQFFVFGFEFKLYLITFAIFKCLALHMMCHTIFYLNKKIQNLTSAARLINKKGWTCCYQYICQWMSTVKLFSFQATYIKTRNEELRDSKSQELLLKLHAMIQTFINSYFCGRVSRYAESDTVGVHNNTHSYTVQIDLLLLHIQVMY